MPDALQMLRDDHHKVKDLFRRFEEAEDSRQKGQIVEEALKELTIHAELEDEIFYPAMRRESGAEGEMMDEADEEHHVAEMLIDELWNMRPGSSHYDAKFTVLAETVKHHIDEEESEMLPKAAELGLGRMQELGAEMERRRMQLMQNGAGRMKSGSRGSTSAAPRRSTGGRRATASGSRNGRSTRTTSRSTSRNRPRATTSTRTRSGGTKTSGGRSRTATASSRRSTGRTASRSPSRSRSTTRSRTTGGRGSPNRSARSRSTSSSRARGGTTRR